MTQTPKPSASSLRVEYAPFGSPANGRRPRGGSRRRRPSLRGIGIRTAGVALAALLPFLILVRLSVALYARWGWGSWGSVLGAGLATAALLVLYAWLIRIRFQGKATVPRAVLGALAALVGAYLVYLLIYLSSANAKAPEIRTEFRSLHPVMRVALSSVLLVDREAMVTDVGRTAEDYRSWGLSVNEASLHFEQETGFVHAVDLRTQGRSSFKNGFVAVYFRAMGFKTLRHVGTADHLHVSLPPG